MSTKPENSHSLIIIELGPGKYAYTPFPIFSKGYILNSEEKTALLKNIRLDTLAGAVFLIILPLILLIFSRSTLHFSLLEAILSLCFVVSLGTAIFTFISRRKLLRGKVKERIGSRSFFEATRSFAVKLSYSQLAVALGVTVLTFIVYPLWVLHLAQNIWYIRAVSYFMLLLGVCRVSSVILYLFQKGSSR